MANNNPKVVADADWYVGEDVTAAAATVSGALANAASAGGFGVNMARQTLTFDTTPAGAIDLFTVTGAVIVQLVAICTVDLTIEAGATLEVGTADTTDGIIAQTAGDTIDAGEIWFAAAPATVLDTLANGMLSYIIGDGADIIATVGTEAINTGTIVFTAFWTPLTADGNVVAA